MTNGRSKSRDRGAYPTEQIDQDAGCQPRIGEQANLWFAQCITKMAEFTPRGGNVGTAQVL
jgi:hypothetical protein